MKQLKILFGRAVEKVSVLPIKVLSQGMAVPVGHMTHKLMSAMDKPEEFKSLLDRDYAEMSDINCVFRFACSRGHFAAVRLMLEECRPLITQKLDSSLVEAVRLSPEPYETAKALLEHGAKPVAQSHFINGSGAIHEAASHNQPELVALLLQHGADPRMKCKEGHEPLEYAVGQPYCNLYSSAKVVDALVKAGADLHLNNDQALRSATLLGDKETVSCLLQAGADKNIVDDKGRNLLQIAEAGIDHANNNKGYYGDRLPLVLKAHEETVELVKKTLFPTIAPGAPKPPKM
ncbi:MAG: ankyrin repeat domain-containing protein [Alphaproteobacteria bacterium]